MSGYVEWHCPDCGVTNTDGLENEVVSCTNGCGKIWDWSDLEGFQRCSNCANGFESEAPGLCSYCLEYERHLQDLWKEFMSIPGADDKLPIEFHNWEVGDSRGAIWEWFEEQAPRGIHFVMYTSQEDLDDYEANK